MNARAFVSELLAEYKDEILRVAQDLIHIPSQNMPPNGQEEACQEYIAGYLRRAGLDAESYEPDQVPGLVEHPSYWPGRTYHHRPNVTSLLPGLGGGRSLLLTGHVDTVALGENVWTYPPFGAEIHDGKLYGLGSIDMKGPLGATLVLYRAIAEKGLKLKGGLRFESVVDEEEGGVNATIAGRLHDGMVDGAVITECTYLNVYPAARGALIVDFIFHSTKGTWLEVGRSTETKADAVLQMGLFLSHIPELTALRLKHPVPPLYTSYPDPVPVQVTKVYAGGWGSMVPIAVPPEGRIELIMQTLPGEKREDVYREMIDWLDTVMARHPEAFEIRPEIRYRLRWMVPTAIAPDHPIVLTMVDSARQVLGKELPVLGAPYACDMFALQQIFNIPGIVFGPTGANAHAADEYVEVDSLFAFWEALLVFIIHWCGV
jgi:acetylornithine deacetylase